MLKGKAPLLIAVGLGVTAGIVAVSALKLKEHELSAGLDPVPVLVAASDISAGTEVTIERLAQGTMPSRFVTASNVKLDDHTVNTLLGQRVLVDIHAGDPITWTMFDTSQGVDRLSHAVLTHGRAVTISVSERGGVAGWVRPGDHIDVVSVFRDQSTNQMAAQTILEDVLVLAAGSAESGAGVVGRFEQAKKSYTTLSVLALPEEAERLTLAQEVGSINVTLRNPEDISRRDDKPVVSYPEGLSVSRMHSLEKIRVQIINGREPGRDLGAKKN